MFLVRSVNIPLLLLCLFILLSCDDLNDLGKIKRRGCTDYDALNFDPKATDNDNSCYYNANIYFSWEYDSYWNHMDSVEIVRVYVDGNFVGWDSLSNYYNLSSCDNPPKIKWLNDTIYHPDIYRLVEYRDQDNDVLASGLRRFNHGSCHIIDYEF